MARRLAGDLEDEFLANGAGEVVVGVGDDDEGTGAADDAISVVEVEVLIGRIAEGARPVVDDGEAVDRHPGGDGAVAGGGHLLALVVGPVAREIDDLAHAGEAVALEERQRVVDGAANRRPGTGEDRDFRELLRKSAGRRLVLDQVPIDQFLLVEPRPFHIGDGDAAQHPP